MANILKVSSEEVRTKASEIQAQKEFMNSIMEDMGRKVNELSESWQSQAGEEYRGKYQNVTKNITASLENLMTHITNLTDAAAKYEELENTQVQKVETLSSNNIF